MRVRQPHADLVTMSRPDELGLHEKPVSKTWIVTFSDLISLMLTFFVMLFSMSNVNLDKWDQITDTLQRTLIPTEETEQINFQPSDFNISTLIRESAANLDYLASVMEEICRRMNCCAIVS